MSTAVNRPMLTWVDGCIAILVLGCLSMSRTFVHLGMAPFYIGETCLLALLVASPKTIVLPWLDTMVRPGPASGVVWCIYLGLVHAAVQCLRGIAAGYDPGIAVQCAAMNAYPIFLLAGISAGVRNPRFLPRIVEVLSWVHGIYGVLYLTVFAGWYVEEREVAFSDGSVTWFGQPNGAVICLLGLLSFQPKLKRVWIPLLLNAFILLGLQIRSHWLGMAISLVAWGILTGRLGALAKVMAASALLLAVGWITDVKIPSPATHANEISVRMIVGRALSAFDSSAAKHYDPYADAHSGTIDWRTEWWKKVWRESHRDPARALIGPGYGYPIWDLHPDVLPRPIRTPHSIFFFNLGYTGWTGLLLFYSLQLTLGWLLWQACRSTGNPFGLCYWLFMLVGGLLDNYYEAPFGGIPFYLLAGLAAAPAVAERPPTPSADGTAHEEERR